MGRFSIFWLILVGFPALFLLSIKIGLVPAVWYDEGEFLLTARSMAETGRYGLPLYDEFRGAHISVGPIVLIPIALAFKTFGISVVVGRVTIALWSLAALYSISILAGRIFGKRASLPAGMLLLIFYSPRFIWYCRTVLGEIPALALIMLGFIFLTMTSGDKRESLVTPLVSILLAGVCFGLAVSAKPHSIFIFPALFIGALCSTEPRRALSRVLQITIMASAIEGISIWFMASAVGLSQYFHQLELLHGAASALTAYKPFELAPRLDKLPNLSFLLALTICAGIYLQRRRRYEWYEYSIFIFSLIYQLWFLLFAYAWDRYLIIGLWSICIILVGAGSALFDEMNEGVKKVALMLFGAFVIGAFAGNVRELLNLTPVKDPYLIAKEIDALPSAAVVESYEWEVFFLVDRNMRQASLEKHYAMLSNLVSGVPTAEIPGESHPRPSDYLLIGPFGERMLQSYREKDGICTLFQSTSSCQLITSHGEYRLYRLL